MGPEPMSSTLLMSSRLGTFEVPAVFESLKGRARRLQRRALLDVTFPIQLIAVGELLLDAAPVAVHQPAGLAEALADAQADAQALFTVRGEQLEQRLPGHLLALEAQQGL